MVNTLPIELQQIQKPGLGSSLGAYNTPNAPHPVPPCPRAPVPAGSQLTKSYPERSDTSEVAVQNETDIRASFSITVPPQYPAGQGPYTRR